MLYEPWKKIIVDAINQCNDLTLAHDDLTLVPLDGSGIMVTPADKSKYVYHRLLYLRKLSIEAGFRGIPVTATINEGGTVSDVIDSVSLRYGVAFDKAVDFDPAELERPVVLTGPTTLIDIPIITTSPIWEGVMSVIVVKAENDRSV